MPYDEDGNYYEEYWIGTSGPFYLYPQEQVASGEENEDNSVDTTPVTALRTSGQLTVGTAPSLPAHVVRYEELSIFASEVAVDDVTAPDLSAYGPPTKLLIVSGNLSGRPAVTLYVFSTVPTAEVSPFILTGTGGYWVAVAGLYNANA